MTAHGRALADARAATRRRHPSARHAGARPGDGPTEARVDGGQVLLGAVVAVLCLVGLVMVLSASSVQALRESGSSWVFFRRQVLWVLAGSVALVACWRVDYRVLRRAGLPVLALSVVLLAAVLVPGVGIEVGGSTRWIGVGGWRMQPSELAKLGLLLFAADLLARRPPESAAGARARRSVLGALALVAVLILRQPDLGTTLVAGGIVLAVLHVAGTPLRTMSALVGAGVGATFALGLSQPYRRERMLSFLNPWADADNTGYQVVQSLIGLGTGRVTGVGVGASRAKWGFLPNAHNDFIFAIIGEELGMVGSLLVLGLFLVFGVLGIRTALRAPDRFGTLVAAGITAWVMGQAMINIGAVVGTVPVTGVPLPFVSFGGSSLVLLLGAVGVLLNIAGHGGAVPAAGAPARARR